eukprot:gb/GEZN01005000.1/.p1 GENE.gb/GEZN01005000.1/~~gb/GEZN01005000.1/.p1  ORF type:complete len:579 (-),score=86.13 gb/GEZN01005000.1/:102-1838(-)
MAKRRRMSKEEDAVVESALPSAAVRPKFVSKSKFPDRFQLSVLLERLDGRQGEAGAPVRVYPLCKGMVVSLWGGQKALQESKTEYGQQDVAELFQRLIQLFCHVSVSRQQARQAWQEASELSLLLAKKLDKASGKLLRKEPYSLGKKNTELSEAVLARATSYQQSQSRAWLEQKDNPFKRLRLSMDPKEFGNFPAGPCAGCSSKAKTYCPQCLVWGPNVSVRLPPLTLPVAFDIILHPQENRKKSTALQAAVLCPTQITVREYPEVPYYDPSRTLLLYPSEEAVFLDELDTAIPRKELKHIECIVVIEATWIKAPGVATCAALQGLRRVRIRDRETTFWRAQGLGKRFLSTLEALYYSSVDMWLSMRRAGLPQSVKMPPSSSSLSCSSSSSSVAVAATSLPSLSSASSSSSSSFPSISPPPTSSQSVSTSSAVPEVVSSPSLCLSSSPSLLSSPSSPTLPPAPAPSGLSSLSSPSKVKKPCETVVRLPFVHSAEYDGHLDDLLLLYAAQHNLITTRYDSYADSGLASKDKSQSLSWVTPDFSQVQVHSIPTSTNRYTATDTTITTSTTHTTTATIIHG